MRFYLRTITAVLSLSLTASTFAQSSSSSGDDAPRAGGRRAEAANSSSGARAQTGTPALAPIPIEQFRLANGLRVILNRDTSVPVISVAIYYDVGSRNERKGRTGFAHLFEHMMFRGSQNIPKGAHSSFIFRSGGVDNATTNTERTYYYATLPASQLPLALWLESDRMRSLNVTQESLDLEIKAVQEEKRMRFDNQPYVPSIFRLNEMLFHNFANAHTVIGSMEDLQAATLADVREFFRIYYAPNNAVLAISGDFDSREARRLVEQYFGNIPRQPAPPTVDVSEPPAVVTREAVFNDPFARIPVFRIGWKIPARQTPAFYALRLASDILLDGESSRLYRRIVKGDESALIVVGGIDERRGPSTFAIIAAPKPGREAARIRQTIYEEIRRLATEGPTAEEMEKLRNNLLAAAARGYESAEYRAARLAEFALFDNDPNLFNTELDNYLRITPEQIKQAVARHLDTENRAVLDVVPASSGGGQAAPGTAAPTRPVAPAQPPGSPPPPPPTTSPTPRPSPTPAPPVRP